MAVNNLRKCQESDSHRDYLAAIKNLSENIINSDISLLEVVENVRDYLIHEEAQKRGKGLRILGDIINILPINYLRQEEAAYFIRFFGERLKDTPTISDALYGLKVLSGKNGLLPEEIDSILSFIFQEVYTQALVQKDREAVFTIFHNFLDNHLKDLKAINEKFLTGFLQAMEGEKDPRNLALLFNMIPSIINHFNIENMVEEFFDVTSCYFPVDYSPPPNDSRGVTKDDLVNGLRKCLTSTTKFSENLIPLLLEKIESDMNTAKLDALNALIECCKTYTWDNFKPLYADIWKTIRRETFSSIASEVTETILSALTSVFTTTSTRQFNTDESEYKTLIKGILDECATYLGQPDAQFLVPTVSLINALSQSTLEIAEKIFHTMFPTLLNRYTLSVELNHRRTSLDAINQLLKSYLKMYQHQDEGPLSTHMNAIWTLFNDLLDSNDPWNLKSSAIEGFVTIGLTKSLSSPNEQLKLLDILTKHSIEHVNAAFGCVCLDAMSKLSESPLTSSTILNHLVPQLKNLLTTDSTQSEKYLQVVSAICTSNDISEAIVPFLIKQLEDGKENSIPIISCIASIAKQSLSNVSTEFWLNKVLLPLVHFLLKCISEETDLEIYFKNVALIYRIVIPYLSESETSHLFLHVLKSFSISADILNCDNIELTPDLSIMLLDSLFGCARRGIFVETNELSVSTFVNKLIKFAFKVNQDSHSSAELAVTAAKCLGSLINKFPSGHQLDEIIESVLASILKCLKDDTTTSDNKTRMVQLLTWTTKSLIMRNHPQMKNFIDTLLACLDDEILSSAVAKEFHIIQRDFEDCFTKSCHANVGILYKQRFFIMTYQKLIEEYNKASGDKSCNYLTALVCQLTLIPKEIFIADAPTLMITLMKGLGTSDTQLLFSILTTLSALIRTDTNLIEKYCDTLIDYLVPLTTYQQSMKIRIEALKCLAEFTTLPTEVILKHKQNVVHRLTASLDDNKRLVRKEAAFARSCWCLVGC